MLFIVRRRLPRSLALPRTDHLRTTREEVALTFAFGLSWLDAEMFHQYSRSLFELSISYFQTVDSLLY